MKKIIIVGATSGIGNCVAREFINLGWKVGVAGRRIDLLDTLKALSPSMVEVQAIDVTDSNAQDHLQLLIDKLGGMNVFLLVSGVGKQNPELEKEIEEKTVKTNVLGFTLMVDEAYKYFRDQDINGHIAVISSIAGTKGLGVAASYSASKGYQNIYIEALSQLSVINNDKISFTDIRPGFVDTQLLSGGKKYPMMLSPEYTAKHIVKAILNKKKVAVIDWRYCVMVFFWKLIPRSIWCRWKVKN